MNSHRAVIEYPVPPRLEVIASGPLDFCRSSLDVWLEQHPLTTYDDDDHDSGGIALVLSTVAEGRPIGLGEAIALGAKFEETARQLQEACERSSLTVDEWIATLPSPEPAPIIPGFPAGVYERWIVKRVAMLELACEGLAAVVRVDWPADQSLAECARLVDFDRPTPEQIAAIEEWEAGR